MPPSRTRYVLPVLVLAAALGVAWLMIAARDDLPRQPATRAAPAVHVQRVAPAPVETTVRSQGGVSAPRATRLASDVAGRVISVSPRLLTGALVESGEELLRIDPIDYEVAVSNAKAAIASAELGLAEVNALRKRAAIAEASARLEAARQALRQAEADLANTVVRAPFAAVIDERNADLGQHLGVGTPLMHLLGTARVEVRLPVLAADLPALQPDQPQSGTSVELRARFGGDEAVWPARLARIEQRVDPDTRAFYAVAEVDAPYDPARHPRALTIGLFVEARIRGRSIEEAVRLPRSVLQEDQSLFVVADGRLRRTEVRVARIEEDTAIVDRGLVAGDAVVLDRLDQMVDGMPVTVAEDVGE